MSGIFQLIASSGTSGPTSLEYIVVAGGGGGGAQAGGRGGGGGEIGRAHV